ncbi:MAG: DUF349 domain-containing protein, partial [Propionibacteriaceae bacterium]|nr:DUF349 domain-containing protein [Propionibacteriaceae bacterium]
LSPDEARKAIASRKAAIAEANAVGDLAGLAAQLDELTPIIDATVAERRAEKARLLEEARAQKTAMAEQAEKLAQSNDWRGGVVKFREMLDEWKGLPRLDRTSDDELWHRFSTARTSYTRRRKAHFAALNEQHEAAQEAKEAILAEAESLADSTDWKTTAAAFRGLMDRWKAAGSAARAVDEELWTKFRAIQDRFFNRRSEVFAQQDEEFNANLQAIIALLDQAEQTILPVTDVAAARTAWREFIGQFNELGRVPREQMRTIDNRVRSLEAAIDEANRREWARTDPQTRANAQGTVSLFSNKLDKLKADLGRAEAAGDQRRQDNIRGQIASIEALLQQATTTLDDLNR